ncbi:F-box only protein [Melia azedarach]|uniref:F-box only protein n=1 Tax=Melia azedarach TaxID=155640 RepID=A0ACC1XCG1_MELAZ|nr:F-box only protein [Melia azedarach]
MELADCLVTRSSRKRKAPEQDKDMLNFSMDELNQDLLERVLSWLPTSTFFRLASVCKRWKSVVNSSSFKLACSQIPSRDPWFLMVDHHLNHSIVFDSAEKCWRELNLAPLLQKNFKSDSMPVAASGGLLCFRKASGNFIVCNPVTGSSRELPPLDPATESQSLHAIVMNTCSKYPSAYKLVLVFGELPKLSFKVYNSSLDCWEEETLLSRKADETLEVESIDDDDAIYFLSKAGNVVATNMQRSPSKQYSSVTTSKDGEEIVYFLNSSGTIVACNLTQKSFSEYPRLLPVFSEYSIDVVECRGEMLVVVLSEFLESASLRVWRFDQDDGSWHQIAAMSPALSHEFYGKKVDINCVGAGDQIFICLYSAEIFSYILCDLRTNDWVELPKCIRNGEAVDFMSAFSFEPRIEASV